MSRSRLILRGLIYYWRTNVAVVLGVTTAVAVLAGALLVGDSVRGSLRALVLQRLGATDLVVGSAGFFRAELADSLRRRPEFSAEFRDLCPLVAIDGFVSEQETGRRAHQVRVYGVDDRFWSFHGVAGQSGPADREAFVSPALAEQIGAQVDKAILVRVQRPSAIPLESLHGQKEDVGRTLRLTVRAIVPAEALGEFSLEPQQAAVRAVFVPLSRLQQELELTGLVNTLLVSATSPSSPALGALEQLVRDEATVEDVGLSVRALEGARGIAVGSDAGLLNDAQVTAVEGAASGSPQIRPVFTYLANSIKHGDRVVPYSLLTAIDLGQVGQVGPGGRVGQAGQDASATSPPIVLNDWAARELAAKVGDPVSIEYFVWEEPGRLATRSADFRVSRVVPVDGADRDLAPVLPGISDSPTLADWDPPFPVDLRRVRPIDERYWDDYRTTPKAFIPLEIGQQLWRSRYGALTSIRVGVADGQSSEALRDAYLQRLRQTVDPLAMGLAVRSVRTDGVAASRGATDFGEYFLYFSFFLVVAALLLAALFFKFGVEQRMKEVGLLRALGFGPAAVRQLFLGEGLLLSVVGSALGVGAAIGYGWLMMYALRTWWVDAVGTTALSLHVTATSLAAGAVGGIVAAVLCIWWTLRGLAAVSERSLLAGQLTTDTEATRPERARRFGYAAGALGLVGGTLIVAAATGSVNGAGAFFGAGTALLAAALCLLALALRLPPRSALAGRGWRALSSFGLRNATSRPGRTVLSMAVIASATFILISVDAFRREGGGTTEDRHSGTGGYALLVESLLPVAHDPNTDSGREALNLFDLDPAAHLEPFRLLPGDDASCLNLYEPRNPRILAPTDEFRREGRFAFASSLATTDAERANPWLLLDASDPAGVVPIIADANSMTYVLHRSLGEEIVIPQGGSDGGAPIRLRLVAALRDSIFQGELLMSQANFRRLFPEQEGYRFFLVDAPADKVPAVTDELTNAFSDVGAEVMGTADRIAEFHRVENTYLSTFQTLGGLGLLLGTIGLSTIVLRNVLERRKELALLSAVGYTHRHFLFIILAENTALLAGGLAIGAVCAGLAIAPAVAERGGRIPITEGGALLLFGVFVTGVLSSLVATRAATRGPLLESLRSE